MSDKSKTDTEQSEVLKRNPDGTFAKGTGVPAGFNKHPENRHNGSWHKEDTPRYWLELMMKWGEQELLDYYADESNPLFIRKMAKCIRDGDWQQLKEMIEQVYGKMPIVNINMDSEEQEAEKFIKGFVIP